MENNNYLDLATKLYNKNFLLSNIDSIIKDILTDYNNGISWSILFCDVNGLKKINDTLGHDKADEGLKKIAKILQKSVRLKKADEFKNHRKNRKVTADKIIRQAKIDKTAVRMGGDEFIVLLSNCTKEQAIIVQDRIQKNIEKNKSKTLGMTLSIGIANTSEVKADQKVFEETLNLADQRMYKAKEEYYHNLPWNEKVKRAIDEITDTIKKYFEVNSSKKLDLKTTNFTHKLLSEEIIKNDSKIKKRGNQ